MEKDYGQCCFYVGVFGLVLGCGVNCLVCFFDDLFGELDWYWLLGVGLELLYFGWQVFYDDIVCYVVGYVFCLVFVYVIGDDGKFVVVIDGDGIFV